jgi:hypothetical protein
MHLIKRHHQKLRPEQLLSIIVIGKSLSTDITFIQQKKSKFSPVICSTQIVVGFKAKLNILHQICKIPHEAEANTENCE